MQTGDLSFFDRAYGRIFRIMIAITVAGTFAAGVREGTRGGAGFLAGAAFSMLNYRWLKQLTAALAGQGTAGRSRRAVVFGLRYFLFGVAVYVIVKVFGISLLAVLLGLLVAVAAVILEILYELTYART